MKLNLLPTHVSKEKVTRTALLLSILLFVVCILGAIGLYVKAGSDLTESQDGIAKLRGEAQRAKDVADTADRVMQQSVTLLRNTQLAESMLSHNKAYPDLYDNVNRYIPAFFRVNSESAAASGPGQSTVTLVGVLDTYQQYADLMLALLRIPGVVSVSRTGFVYDPTIVPAPTEVDQYGKPRKAGDAPIPDDPLQRLEYFQAKGGVTGYQNQGGFGSGQPGLRGPMPNQSQVTVTLVIGADLQTPDPRATLASGGGATNTNQGGPNATGGQTPNAPSEQLPQKGARRGAPGRDQE